MREKTAEPIVWEGNETGKMENACLTTYSIGRGRPPNAVMKHSYHLRKKGLGKGTAPLFSFVKRGA